MSREHYFSVLYFAILPIVTFSTDFRGGTIYVDPLPNGQILISHRTFWLRSATNRFCDQSTIDAGTATTVGLLFCNSGCPPSPGTSLGFVNYACVDYSEQNDWTSGEGSITYTTPAEPELELTAFACCWANGGSTLINWRLTTSVTTVMRSGTPLVNASPRALIIPIIHLAYGCSHVIQIPVEDPDGDVVKCRLGTDQSECGDACGAVPGVTLDTDACSISIDPDEALEGFHIIALVLEDFIPSDLSSPLSQVSFQFLIFVHNESQPCDSRPTFENSAILTSSCLGTRVNNLVQSQISISNAGSMTDSLEFHFVSSQAVMAEIISGNGGTLVNISWSPTDQEVMDGHVCIYVINSLGSPSPWTCISLRTNGPDIIPSSLSWNNSILFSLQSVFSIQFTTPIRRPEVPAMIYFIDTESATPVYVIDVTSQRGMTEVRYLDAGLLTILPDFRFYPSSDATIAVTLDDNVVVQDDCFIGNQALSDIGFWAFTIRGPCQCPNVTVQSPADVDDDDSDNTTDSHLHPCPEGYSRDQPQDICRDLDECRVQVVSCSHRCENVAGSYRCTCLPGFRLAEDQRTCIDVNECLTQNGWCDFTCVNQEGSYLCLCPLGSHLSNNNHTCIVDDPSPPVPNTTICTCNEESQSSESMTTLLAVVGILIVIVFLLALYVALSSRHKHIDRGINFQPIYSYRRRWYGDLNQRRPYFR